MSSTSPRQGLSKTLRSSKTRIAVVLTLALLTAVFSASALTANLGPSGQQAGSFAASVFGFFGATAVRENRAHPLDAGTRVFAIG